MPQRLNSGKNNFGKIMPRFKHNHCDKCRFVGEAGTHDVWICHHEDSLIARHGNNPCEYASVKRSIYRDNFPKKLDDSRPYIKVWNILVDNPDYSTLIVSHKTDADADLEIYEGDEHIYPELYGLDEE